MTDLRILQHTQPWTVPYAKRIEEESHKYGRKTDLLARHALLHLTKSCGKIASVFEKIDHSNGGISPSVEERTIIENMSADLVTIAMRFANLYNFDLQAVLQLRVEEKNGKGFGDVE